MIFLDDLGLDFVSFYTVKRFSEATEQQGYLVQPEPTTFDIRMTKPQPLTKKQSLELFGSTIESGYSSYSNTKLNLINGTIQADQIVINGINHEIFEQNEYNSYDGDFNLTIYENIFRNIK